MPRSSLFAMVLCAAPVLLLAGAPAHASETSDQVHFGLDRICLPYVAGSTLDAEGELDHSTVERWTQGSGFRAYAPPGPFVIKLLSEETLANGTPRIAIVLDNKDEAGRTCELSFVDEAAQDPLAQIADGFASLGIALDGAGPDALEFDAEPYGDTQTDLTGSVVLSGRRITVKVQGN